MTVELYTDASIGSTQGIDVTVKDTVTGTSETISIHDGYNGYELSTIEGDPTNTYEISLSLTDSDETTSPTFRGAEVYVPGEYASPDDKRDTTRVEWSDEVLYNERGTFDANSYSVEILEEDVVVASFQANSVRISPELNAVKPATISTQPFDWLEDNRFMGSETVIYVDGEDEIFRGKISDIETNQQDEDYNLTVECQCSELKDTTAKTTIESMPAPDAIAKIVDHYNQIDGELGDPTTSTSGVKATQDGGFYVSGRTGTGTVTYKNVGKNASDVSHIYVKCYATDTDTVEINIDDGADQYTETLSNIGQTEYGHWERVIPTDVEQGYYDITFTLTDTARLRDWRAVVNSEIERVIEEPDPGIFSIDKDLYTYTLPDDTKDVWNNNVVNAGTYYRPRQKSAWHVVESTDTNAEDAGAGATYNSALSNSTTTYTDLTKFTYEDEFPAWELWGRVSLKTDNGAGTASYRIETISTNEQHDGTIDTSQLSAGEYEWRKLSDYTRADGFRYDISYGTQPISIKGIGTDDKVYFSDFVVIPGPDADLDFQHEWSDSVTNGQLNYPRKYTDDAFIQFEGVSANAPINDAFVEATIANTTNVQGEFGPVQSTDSGVWPSEYGENNNSLSPKDTSTGILHISGKEKHHSRVYLSSSGERDSHSPRFGYQATQLTEVTVDATYSELSFIYDKEIKNNIVAGANDIANESTTDFRVEGDTIFIFQRGYDTANVDLVKESIKSSRSISDAYASCEVIGLDGVSSGVIKSVNAPDFVTKHKEIRDQSVTTKSQAIQAAESFLAENDTIEYSGSISSLPTFAPIGKKVDGNLFSHGQSMIIESVDYSRGKSSISLGFDKSITDEFINLNRESDNTKTRVTSNDS